MSGGIDALEGTKITDHIFLFLDYHLGQHANFVFSYLRRDHWSKKTKLICFVLLVFGPVFCYFIKMIAKFLQKSNSAVETMKK
jgi:hypothetical protein